MGTSISPFVCDFNLKPKPPAVKDRMAVIPSSTQNNKFKLYFCFKIVQQLTMVKIITTAPRIIIAKERSKYSETKKVV